MYRIVGQLLDPYTFLLIGLLLTSVWGRRTFAGQARSFRVTFLLACILAILSTPLTGYFSLGSLEWRYPQTPLVPRSPDTIVVLSGGLIRDDAQCKKTRLGAESVERCLHAARLYKQAGGCRVIVTGGRGDWKNPCPTLAESMRDFLVESGVKPTDVVLEDQATTTYENALFSLPLLAEVGAGRILLVTSAAHMPRAEGCFRRLGLTVYPAPCDRRAGHHALSPNSFLPSSRGISEFCQASHEWAGYAWYWLRGRV